MGEFQVDKYIFPFPKQGLRRESTGLMIFRQGGDYKFVPDHMTKLLENMDGMDTVYGLSKSTAESTESLATNILWLRILVDEGYLELQNEKPLTKNRFRISSHKPFSDDAFSSPLHVTLGITSTCNRACHHCYRKSYSPQDILNTNELISVIEEISKINVLTLNLTGGEPMTNPDFSEIVSIAGSLVPALTMNTNGTCFTDKQISSMAAANLRRVQIGINVVFDTNDKETSSADAVRVAEFAKALASVGIEVIIAVIPTVAVTSQIDKLLRIVEKAGVKHLRIAPLMDCHEGCTMSSVSYKVLTQSITKILQWGSTTDTRVSFGDGVFTSKLDIDTLEGKRKRFCGLGTGMLHIEANGDIYPCPVLLSDEFRIGRTGRKAYSPSLIDLWKNSEVLKEIRKITVDEISSCADCNIKSACAGGCRALAYWSTGHLLGRYPDCRINKWLEEQHENSTC